ncbi:MAG: amidohydrolase family protein, partial [Dehalococcoidia bacterium]
AAVGYEAMDNVDASTVRTVKIAIKELGDEIYPDEAVLAEMVAEAHARGFQVAVHAVAERAVAAAVAAFEGALARQPRPDHSFDSAQDKRHRIEHCGLCPPDLARRIGSLGLTVVTQPSFLYHNGDRFLRQVAPQVQPHLYPLRSLAQAGARLAASSDCPVVPPDPIAGIYGAVARRSKGGQRLPGEETLDVHMAVAMHTRDAARAAFLDEERGVIAAGMAADLVLLSADPTTVEAEELAGLRVEMTLSEGRVAWRAGG